MVVFRATIVIGLWYPNQVFRARKIIRIILENFISKTPPGVLIEILEPEG